MIPVANPLQRFLDYQGVVVLDGGLATELERRGASLDSALWSAKLLLDDPIHRFCVDEIFCHEPFGKTFPLIEL